MADARQVTKHVSVIHIVLVLLTKHGHIPVICANFVPNHLR